MTTYVLQGPSHAGSAITMGSVGGTAGDLCPTGPGVGLLLNVASGTITVTLPVSTPVDGNLAVASRTFAAPPGISLIPIPSNVYGSGTTAVNYSAATNFTVAAVKVP